MICMYTILYIVYCSIVGEKDNITICLLYILYTAYNFMFNNIARHCIYIYIYICLHYNKPIIQYQSVLICKMIYVHRHFVCTTLFGFGQEVTEAWASGGRISRCKALRRVWCFISTHFTIDIWLVVWNITGLCFFRNCWDLFLIPIDKL